MLVDVYKNLNRGGYSIRDSVSKLVLGHADRVQLDIVTLHVSEKGSRSSADIPIHAYVKGILVSAPNFKPFKDRHIKRSRAISYMYEQRIGVIYNPFKFKSFVRVGSHIPVREVMSMGLYENHVWGYI